MQHGTTGVSYASSDSWIILSEIEQSIKQKINAVGIPLRDWKIKCVMGGEFIKQIRTRYQTIIIKILE